MPTAPVAPCTHSAISASVSRSASFGAGVSSLEQLRRLPAKTVTFTGRLVDALAGEDNVEPRRHAACSGSHVHSVA